MNDNYIQGLRLELDKVDKDSYVRQIEAFNNVNELIFDSPITFFVGENGSGKSTLLEAIAESYGFNKEGGTRNYNFSTYEELPSKDIITLFKGPRKTNYSYFFRAETFFNVASAEEEYSKANPYKESEKYHSKSHGEGFLHLFKSFDKNGLFLLDEPEAALSPQKQLALFSLIHESSNNGSQFIIISHSPILLGIPNATIYEFSDKGINKCKYEDTQSYNITKMFIEHRQSMIDELTKK